MQRVNTARPGHELIEIERESQIKRHGYGKNHDAEHTDGELLLAAFSYLCVAMHESSSHDFQELLRSCDEVFSRAEEFWPFEKDRFNTTSFGDETNLAKAGALIAAEIDRRLASYHGRKPSKIEDDNGA